MKDNHRMTDEEWAAVVQAAAALPDAPPALVQAAIDLWQLHAPRPVVQHVLQRFRALLSFDSWQAAPVAAGMRALRSEVRQLLFTAAAGDVDLRIEPLYDGTYVLSGQVLSADAQGVIELIAANADELPPVASLAALDTSCEFRLAPVRRGSYQLTVNLEQQQIVLPLIDIGPYGEAANP